MALLIPRGVLGKIAPLYLVLLVVHPRTHFLPLFLICILLYSAVQSLLVPLTWYLNSSIFINFKSPLRYHLLLVSLSVLPSSISIFFFYHPCVLNRSLPARYFTSLPVEGRTNYPLLIPVAFLYPQLLARTLGTRFSVSELPWYPRGAACLSRSIQVAFVYLLPLATRG